MKIEYGLREGLSSNECFLREIREIRRGRERGDKRKNAMSQCETCAVIFRGAFCRAKPRRAPFRLFSRLRAPLGIKFVVPRQNTGILLARERVREQVKIRWIGCHVEAAEEPKEGCGGWQMGGETRRRARRGTSLSVGYLLLFSSRGPSRGARKTEIHEKFTIESP